MNKKTFRPKLRTIVKLKDSYYANIPMDVAKRIKIEDFDAIKVFAFEPDRDGKSLVQGTDIIVRLIK